MFRVTMSWYIPTYTLSQAASLMFTISKFTITKYSVKGKFQA